MAHEMVEGAKSILTRGITNFSEKTLFINVKKEQSAFGNGSSIVIVAETTTNCVLGGSGLGSPKEQAYSVGEFAANQLLRSLSSKGMQCRQVGPDSGLWSGFRTFLDKLVRIWSGFED